MRHRSYEIIVEYLRVSRNRHQLRLLQNGHVNENSFTAEEIRSIERILDTVMARCEQEHRHQGSDMRRQSLTQHNQVRFGAAQQTYEENLTYGRTRAVSTPNLSSTPRLRTEDENDLSELSSWAVVTKLASSEADKYSECIICLVPFKTADRVLTLPCFHLFHLDCVLTWLKKVSWTFFGSNKIRCLLLGLFKGCFLI
ncbi:unnamed protein product [Echinostoma caproni]|uniref:RING-type domain-containing protein n=1 Tax=Echinostoma caproni TaxID=27848 RepID=A0A183AFR5_9TREM|nr:unnamed protein product [Echinostoma caproni]